MGRDQVFSVKLGQTYGWWKLVQFCLASALGCWVPALNWAPSLVARFFGGFLGRRGALCAAIVMHDVTGVCWRRRARSWAVLGGILVVQGGL